MMPHYLSHSKSKAGKYLDSKRDNRCANFNRGKGRKPVRPKGAECLRVLPLCAFLFSDIMSDLLDI